MRKALAAAVALLIVLGTAAEAVYTGCVREPGRDVVPRNDEDSPDPESILMRFFERPSDGLLRSRTDEEPRPRLPDASPQEPAGLRVPPSASSPNEPPHQRRRQTGRRPRAEAAFLGLPVGACPFGADGSAVLLPVGFLKSDGGVTGWDL